MKKAHANKLKQIAALLPECWEKEYETVYLSGKDANLCFIGSKKPFRPDMVVEFRCPRFVQINHYRKLKEGIKAKGYKFIGYYISRIRS